MITQPMWPGLLLKMFHFQSIELSLFEMRGDPLSHLDTICYPVTRFSFLSELDFNFEFSWLIFLLEVMDFTFRLIFYNSLKNMNLNLKKNVKLQNK